MLNRTFAFVFSYFFCAALWSNTLQPHHGPRTQNHSHTQPVKQDPFDQLPDLGSNAETFLTESEANKLGKAFIRSSRYRLPYISDPELVYYVNQLGRRLLAKSDDKHRHYQFYLIDNDVINAFAVPGGHIVLHTAILTKSESESELASVIAHEISHITQNHIARRYENSQYDALFALAALLAAAAAGGGDAAQAAFGVANATIIDKQLTYSRAFEAEADALGIRLLDRAGFDVNAMPRFFKRLLDESRLNESHAPEFLRSHPLTIHRITESSERAKTYQAKPTSNSDAFLLMQAKARAKYGKNKQLTRNHFHNLVKKDKTSLANQYGYAIALSENNQYKEARKIFAQLTQTHPNHLSIMLEQANNELEAKNIDTGLELLSHAYHHPEVNKDHLVDLYYANALVLTKRYDTAIPILRAAIANNPTEPYAHILLSRSYGETGETLLSYFERGEYHLLRGNYEFSLQQFNRAKTLANSSYDKARVEARITEVSLALEEYKKLR